MPKSRTHYKRKMKKRQERKSYYAWAERRIEEWNHMDPLEHAKYNGEFLGYWRKRGKEAADEAEAVGD